MSKIATLQFIKLYTAMGELTIDDVYDNGKSIDRLHNPNYNNDNLRYYLSQNPFGSILILEATEELSLW